MLETNTQKPRSTIAANLSREARTRLLGLLPLVFFLAQGIHYLRIDELGHMMWMCNLGNLILALGLFLEKPTLIRVAVIWAIPGLLVWLIYVVLAWGVFLTSTLAHVGGLIIGLVALKKVGMDRISWLYAFVWYLMVQLFCRYFTPADLNVNLAHGIQPGWEQAFSSYWKFWVILTLVAIAILWLAGFLLRMLWPVRSST